MGRRRSPLPSRSPSSRRRCRLLPRPPPPPPPPEPVKPPPRVELRDNKIEFKEKIQFDVNKATIKPESDSLLHDIAEVIKQNPQVLVISIEGHASAEGLASQNKKLSDDRSKSVREHLIKKEGIDAARLTAKGWGIEKPIAPNDTEENREKNRRVEFLVTKQDVTRTKVEIDPTTGKEKVIDSKTHTDVKAEDPAPTDDKNKANPKKPQGPAEDPEEARGSEMMKTIVTAVLGAALLAGCGSARTPEAYRDDTGSVLAAKNDGIKACYDGVIKTNPTAGGKVTVKFTVETEKGTIGEVMVDKANTTAPDPVSECVIANISTGLALNPVDANKGEGTWVYDFQPPAPVGPAMPAPAPAPSTPNPG